jgi:hypothetical protein
MAARFRTVPVSDTGWLIYDTAYPLDDSRHVVAHIEAKQDIFDVTWLRHLRLPTAYIQLKDALHDVEQRTATGTLQRSTRPFKIPHLPPVR